MKDLIGAVIGIVYLCMIFVLINEHNKLVTTKYKFMFFSLRDRLMNLVIEKKIEENSWEYNEIVKIINFHISAIENLSVFRVATLLVSYYLSGEESRSVRLIKRKITNKDVAAIVIEHMSITYGLIKRNSRAQIFIIKIFSLILKSKLNTSKNLQKQIVQNPNNALDIINRQKTEFEVSFC
jgi:hypothetical protein